MARKEAKTYRKITTTTHTRPARDRKILYCELCVLGA